MRRDQTPAKAPRSLRRVQGEGKTPALLLVAVLLFVYWGLGRIVASLPDPGNMLVLGYLALTAILFSLGAKAIRPRLPVLQIALIAASLFAIGLTLQIALENAASSILWAYVFLIPIAYFAFYLLLLRRVGVERSILILGLVLGISAAVELLQLAGQDAAWQLRLAIGGMPTEDSIAALFTAHDRPGGLAYYAIDFANQATTFLPLYLAVIIVQPRIRTRLLHTAVFGIIVLALVGTGTRSALLGAVLGCALVVSVLMVARAERSPRTVVLLLLVGLVAATTFSVSLASPLNRLQSVDDESAAARIPLFLAGMQVLAAHPEGTGPDFPAEFAKTYNSLSGYDGAEFILQTSTHNYFLNIFDYYGVAGGVLNLALYVIVIVQVVRLYRSGERKTLALGAAGAVAAHVVQAALHNGGPFLGDKYAWFTFAAAIALSVYPEETPTGKSVQPHPRGDSIPKAGLRQGAARP